MKNYRLGLSPLTGKVYVGISKTMSNNPAHQVWAGEKLDVTDDFMDIVIQKFPPGGKYQINTVDGKPAYIVTAEEAK